MLTLVLLPTGALSDSEVRAGIKQFGLQMSEDDLDLISLYLQDNGVNGELTLSMFMDFVALGEMELPTPEKPKPKAPPTDASTDRASCANAPIMR